MNHWSEMK